MVAVPKSRWLIGLCLLALFGIITFAFAAATLGTLNKHYKSLRNLIYNVGTPIPANTSSATLNAALAELIRIDELMKHLNQLEHIANQSHGTRAIGTSGFNLMVDYISGYLRNNTRNLNLTYQAVPIRNFSVVTTSLELTLSTNGTHRSLSYSAELAKSDFTYVNYSRGVARQAFQLAVVSNYGCDTTDWWNVTGRAALVKAGGTCTSSEKGELANKYNAAAILFYNNGESVSSLAPVNIRLRQANNLPALYLSYAAGERLRKESNQTDVSVTLRIELATNSTFHVSNICADTVHGNVSETIVIGSHSDSVPAGPGINDNGSGTVATLVLATTLAHLYENGSYPKYKYRVRFCWWGGEEIGLAGSIHHVQQAKSSSVVGERLQDYLINLNYDMLGSPNYIFGIYDGSSAKKTTPRNATKGSVRVTERFRSWFDEQNLPWDSTDFSGRSDYGPFLAEGIAAGGLFSGADGKKTPEQRSRYGSKIGAGQGGFAGAIRDPCYHQACDTVGNINQFCYQKMVQAAAYMLEYLGQQNDLKSWLYSN